MQRNNDTKVLGIIPMRFASTRFPGKALVEIFGKTLIQRVYENALRCSALDALVIATDDARIANHAEEFGATVVMTSLSCPTGSDRLAEVIRNHEKYKKFQYIMSIQGDEPCVHPETISQVIEACRLSQAPMSTAITLLVPPHDPHSPSIVKCVFNKLGEALYFSRSVIPYGHEAPYYRHLGLYCFERDFLLRYAELPATPLQLSENLEQLRALEHGYRIQTVVVHDEAIGVDTPEDIATIERILCKQNTFSLLAESPRL